MTQNTLGQPAESACHCEFGVERSKSSTLGPVYGTFSGDGLWMESSYGEYTLDTVSFNPGTGVIVKGESLDTHRTDGHVEMEAEMGALQPPAKDHLGELQEARKGPHMAPSEGAWSRQP